MDGQTWVNFLKNYSDYVPPVKIFCLLFIKIEKDMNIEHLPFILVPKFCKQVYLGFF